jgi:hypothetical protein
MLIDHVLFSMQVGLCKAVTDTSQLVQKSFRSNASNADRLGSTNEVQCSSRTLCCERLRDLITTLFKQNAFQRHVLDLCKDSSCATCGCKMYKACPSIYFATQYTGILVHYTHVPGISVYPGPTVCNVVLGSTR